MCGISIWFQNSGLIDKNKFKKMNDSIRHRGPDDEGYYYDAGLAMAHRRLAIIDVSPKGHQPFMYKDRYVLVFNGEIYNYIELREELKLKGYTFNTETDTEVLIAAYDHYGEACTNYLNGMWAFVIYDKKEKILFGSRDRFGIKPLYYYFDNGKLLLASEIKQILIVEEQCAQVNRNILEGYLVYGDLDYSDETFFKDIYKIPMGNSFQYRLGDCNFKSFSYYKPDYMQKGWKYKNYHEACDAFFKTFEQSVKLRLRSDVKVGYCLSGGLDSSAIVCMVDKVLKESQDDMEQHVISSCSYDKRYDEQEYIDEVIRQTGVVSHKVFPLENRLLDELDEIIWHMDEPFGSTSIYAQWNVFKKAKECGLKVMLDGQGADEQLAGYTPFYKVLFCNYLRRMRWIRFYTEWKAYKAIRCNTEKHLKPPSIRYLLAVAYLPDKLAKWLEKRVSKNLTPFSDRMLETSRVNSAEMYNIRKADKYFMDSLHYGMQALLHYEDRNSMAFSIESRVPFLDVNLVNCLAQMPIDYKIRDARTKAVMRDALKEVLPEKIRHRMSKLGFVTPEDIWIQQNKATYREELIKACDNLQGIVDKAKVLKWYDNETDIIRGDSTVWRIICAGHWIDVFHVRVN